MCYTARGAKQNTLPSNNTTELLFLRRYMAGFLSSGMSLRTSGTPKRLAHCMNRNAIPPSRALRRDVLPDIRNQPVAGSFTILEAPFPHSAGAIPGRGAPEQKMAVPHKSREPEA